MDDPRSSEVNGTVAKVPGISEVGQPAATPDPVRIETVRKGDPECVDAEILPAPSFGHRSGGDRGGRIHEHHHEEEQRQHTDVVHPFQEEPFGPHQAVIKCARGGGAGTNSNPAVQQRQSRAQRGIPAWWHGAIEPVTPTKGEAVSPEGGTTERINHQVHGGRVRRILCPTEADFHQHESGLHEHHEKSRDQHPDHVNRIHVVSDSVIQLVHRHRRGLVITNRSRRRRDPITSVGTRCIGPQRRRRIRTCPREIGWKIGYRRRSCVRDCCVRCSSRRSPCCRGSRFCLWIGFLSIKRGVIT